MRACITPRCKAALPIAPERVEHAFEYQKDVYVPIEKTALAQLAAPTSTEIALSEFVKLDQIDPVYFETSYFVLPGNGGEKPYALLYRALHDAAYVGIASMAMHRREHTVVLRPGAHGLLLHTMFYADEVRSEQEYHAAEEINPKELTLATTLVNALAGDFDISKYKDPYREKLQALIDERQPTSVPAEAAPRTAAPVTNIMEALHASLAKLKKPVREESVAKAPAKAKRAARKAG